MDEAESVLNELDVGCEGVGVHSGGEGGFIENTAGDAIKRNNGNHEIALALDLIGLTGLWNIVDELVNKRDGVFDFIDERPLEHQNAFTANSVVLERGFNNGDVLLFPRKSDVFDYFSDDY